MTKSPLNKTSLLPEVRRVAQSAANEVMHIYQSSFKVSYKKDKSPLTEADLVSHRVVEKGLRQLTPEIPILSEESAHVSFAQRKLWKCYWLVDPLDGTKNFVRRNGEFTVNIALIEEHQPTLGVIVVPTTGMAYTAVLGQGANSYNSNNRSYPLTMTIRKSEQPWRVTLGHSRVGATSQLFFQHLKGHEKIFMGSSLKFCTLAEGQADIYPCFGPTSEWDTAAGQCILTEAGGRVTDLSINTLRYNTKDSLINLPFVAFRDLPTNWNEFQNLLGS